MSYSALKTPYFSYFALEIVSFLQKSPNFAWKHEKYLRFLAVLGTTFGTNKTPLGNFLFRLFLTRFGDGTLFSIGIRVFLRLRPPHPLQWVGTPAPPSMVSGLVIFGHACRVGVGAHLSSIYYIP